MIYSGVYEIKNKKNEKRYIGSSQNINNRLCHHLSLLRNNNHHSIYLQRAWNKHGKDNFVFKPLLYCDPETTLFFEQLCIDRLIPEYNIAKCAEASARGAKRSKETRRKIGEVQKGRIVSKKLIEKRVKSREGYRHSEYTKEKIRISVLNRNKTKEGKISRKNAIDATCKKVLCLDNNIVYSSIKEAAKNLGVNSGKISCVANGKRSHTGGLRFSYAGVDK